MKRGTSTITEKADAKRPKLEGGDGSAENTGKAGKEKYTFIVFDVETTGLASNPHITQITALALDQEDPFNRFVLPKKEITDDAHRLTGLRLTRSGLQLREKLVKSIKISKAMKLFLQWLKQFPNVVLVGNYGRKFDFAVLLLAAKNTGYEDRLKKRVHSYVDSCELFRKFHPGLGSYSKETLLRTFLGQPYRKSGAIVDITNFRNLIDTKFPDRNVLLRNRFDHSGIDLNDITQ